MSAFAAERKLVDECLAGCPIAWTTFVAAFKPLLSASIAKCVGGNGRDHPLVEDLVQEVFAALVENGFERLKLFDSQRARLGAFLSGIARLQVLAWKRRCARTPVPAVSVDHLKSDQIPVLASDSSDGVMLDEFVCGLTPRLRAYTVDLLGGSEPLLASTMSASNGRKLKERIRKKLRHYCYYL